ncbi:MAG: hypothetical protein WBD22_11995 [Pyrinomonadaceae bacterium]
MSSKQCEKCGELVAVGKAFCPGCGLAFVSEEVRTDVAEYDRLAGTMQFGKTAYLNLLADLDLEVKDPATDGTTPRHAAVQKTPLESRNPTSNGVAPSADATAADGSSALIWILVGFGAGFVFLAILALILIFLILRSYFGIF